MRKIFILTLLIVSSASWGQFGGSLIDVFNSTWGFLQGLLPSGSSSLRVAQSQYGGGTGPGKVVNGVNLLTGQPSYSIPLTGMSVRGVSFPVVLTYSGGIKSQVASDNRKAPTSWVGLGFDLSVPFVATNHKGTYASSDDVLYCNLGPYGGGQLIQNSPGTKFQVSSNPYIKVAYEIGASGEYDNQFTRWTFTFPDGKKMIFGQDSNAQRYAMYNNGKIVASPLPSVSSKKFIYRWDLSVFYDTIPGALPKNKISFEYERFLEGASSNKSYVREAYVKNIKWVEGSQEVERLEFKTVGKDSTEYAKFSTYEPRDDQRLFETRRLDTLKCLKEGQLDYFYKFDWITQPKGLLSKIRVFYPRPRPAYLPNPLSPDVAYQDSGWTFEYENSSKYYLLKSVTAPNSQKSVYSYVAVGFDATAGDLDAYDYVMMRRDTVTPVTLPSSDASLDLWSIQSSCDERFCYTLVRDGDNESIANDTTPTGAIIKQKVYVEIRRNFGNFVDKRYSDNARSPVDTITARFELGDNTTPAAEWLLIPSGDYVLIVNKPKGKIWIYENDGVRWKEQKPFDGDSRYNTSTGFGVETWVSASTNYFLVQKHTTPSEVIVAFRKPNGWTTLNRDGVCGFSNKANYGESIRNTATLPCLEWSDLNITMQLQPAYFLILDNLRDVVCAYGLRANGEGFEELSNKFGSVSSPTTLQVSGYPMNWAADIQGIYTSQDYFLVLSGQSGNRWLHGFYFDGDTLFNILTQQVSSGPTVQISAYPSNNYFLLADGGNGISFWQKAMYYGVIQFLQQGSPKTDYNGTQKLLIRAQPDAFSIEYYKYDHSIGLRPKHESSSQYASYLFHVNRSHINGWADRSSQLAISGMGGRKLFNISFSGSDNTLTGSYAQTSAGGNCDEDALFGSCSISYFAAKTQPEDLSTYVGTPVFIPSNYYWTTLKQSHRLLSNCARLGTEVVLDKTQSPGRIHVRHLQFDGKGYWTPESLYVVNTVAIDAALDGSDIHSIKYKFEYNPGTAGIREYNCNLQLPHFEFADITQRNSINDSLGRTRFFFNIDKQNEPMNGVTMFLNGTERYSATLGRGLDTLVRMTSKNTPFRSPSWAGPLYVNRPTVSYSMTSSPSKGRISDTTYYLNYCDTNGSPRYTLSVNRPDKILLSQRMFDSLGFTKQSMFYKLPLFPDTSMMKVWDNDNSHADSPTVAATKTKYSGYYFVEDSLWRETDQTLTDQDLRTGKDPTFSLLSSWLPGRKVSLRDTNFYQVLETKAVKSKVANAVGESYSSIFYEGLRSDPVAAVQNAKHENCAVLMGESGNAGLSTDKLDHRGRWERVGASFSDLRSHTGRYCMKVVDHYGPTVNLRLKDVRDLGFGFRVSAWIYSDNGAPKLAVERRGAGYSDVTYGNPVAGSSGTQRVWQRWEAFLPYSKLTANGLFNGGNDSLRIWVGTGSPTGNSANIVYVDDIVCAPTNATFQLTTYDRRGPVTSVTDAFHKAFYYDLGFKGQVIAVRDEERRSFGQGAFHAMGEN